MSDLAYQPRLCCVVPLKEACHLAMPYWQQEFNFRKPARRLLVGCRRTSRLKGSHKESTDVQRPQTSQGTLLSIYGQPHHDNQYRKPQIPNKTTSGEALFLSTGLLAFRTSVVVALGVRRTGKVVLSAKRTTLSGSALIYTRLSKGQNTIILMCRLRC